MGACPLRISSLPLVSSRVSSRGALHSFAVVGSVTDPYQTPNRDRRRSDQTRVSDPRSIDWRECPFVAVVHIKSIWSMARQAGVVCENKHLIAFPGADETFPIEECSYSREFKEEDTIMRLKFGDLKFYAHKKRATFCQDELVEAVLHPDVKQIKT